jgi:hypothetical protein
VGYLRLHPDIPLPFNCSTTPKEISAINFTKLDPPIVAQVNALAIDVIPTWANISFDLNPDSFTSCKDFHLFHAKSKRSPLTDGAPPTSLKQQGNLVIDRHEAEISRISPPTTECLIDANLPGRLYERMATSGGSIEMEGTTAIFIAQKQTTMAESSTEAEIAAAADLGKILRWLVRFMNNMGLPFLGPIPIAEDNAATKIIAHFGKVTRNVRHVAIKTLALQGLVRNEIAVFNAIGTDNNQSNHFTKPTISGFLKSCSSYDGNTISHTSTCHTHFEEEPRRN